MIKRSDIEILFSLENASAAMILNAANLREEGIFEIIEKIFTEIANNPFVPIKWRYYSESKFDKKGKYDEDEVWDFNLLKLKNPLPADFREYFIARICEEYTNRRLKRIEQQVDALSREVHSLRQKMHLTTHPSHF